MKKLLILMIALLPIVAYAQEKQSVVTLKNGTELKGVIKAIDPTDALTIVIAGIETKIKMADVAKVEEIANSSVSSDTNEFPKSVLRKGEKIVVTDKADYPESFVLNIGDCEINMILVRGVAHIERCHTNLMNRFAIHTQAAIAKIGRAHV